MSNQINVSSNYVKGRCDLKCAYNFTYKVQNVTASHNNTNLLLLPEDREDYCVLYNKEKYRVFWIILNNSSDILYNDNNADAEIIIVHMSESGKYLFVFIPIKVSSETTNATTILTETIKSISSSAPSSGEEVNISGFDLQKIVPNKPFYSCKSGSYDCICFGMLDATTISSTSLNTLKQLVKPTDSKFSIDGGLFYNASGPNTTTEMGDGIYISCNPTGSSLETEQVTYAKNAPNYDIVNIFEDKYVLIFMQVFFACLIFIIICYVWNYGFKILDGEFGMSKTNNLSKTSIK